MSSLPASLKRIGSIAIEKKWCRRFFRRSRAAYSIVSGGIWPKFKLIQAFIHVLITCKYEKDPIKTAEKMWWRSFPYYKSMGIFSDTRAANSVVRGRIRPNFELMQALMYVIVTCKYKKDLIKNSREMWWRPFPHYNPMGAIRCHGNQSSDLICIKTYAAFPPSPMMLQIKFACNRPAGLGDIHVWKCGRTDAGSSPIL